MDPSSAHDRAQDVPRASTYSGLGALRRSEGASRPIVPVPHPGDRLLGLLFERVFRDARLRFALSDGSVLASPAGEPVATIAMRDRWTALSLLGDPENRFGDDYASGRIDVQGNLIEAIEEAYAALRRIHRGGRRLWLHGHSLRRSKRNAQRHYDLGNDFYKAWLDEQMVYTCAYFPRPDASLEEAQEAKMDRVCRKLRLRPGERVVEAGCGWGALALHMARRYGVTVRAFNVSREQIRYARERAQAEGLAERVEFVEEDYRRISGRYDAFVSVGMLEHVGLERYGELGRVIRGSLDPEHGRGLLHFIGRDLPRPLNRWIRRNIFPGAYPPTLSEVFERVTEPQGFTILDVENLRPHYARTLQHWLSRYLASEAAVRERYGEPFARSWRLYLAGSQAAFRVGSMQLFQIVFAPSEARDPAWGRGEDDRGDA